MKNPLKKKKKISSSILNERCVILQLFGGRVVPVMQLRLGSISSPGLLMSNQLGSIGATRRVGT